MNNASIPNFSFLGSLEVAQIYLPGWPGGWVGLTVIIELVSVQIGLNWKWSTGTDLSNINNFKRDPVTRTCSE